MCHWDPEPRQILFRGHWSSRHALSTPNAIQCRGVQHKNSHKHVQRRQDIFWLNARQGDVLFSQAKRLEAHLPASRRDLQPLSYLTWGNASPLLLKQGHVTTSTACGFDIVGLTSNCCCMFAFPHHTEEVFCLSQTAESSWHHWLLNPSMVSTGSRASDALISALLSMVSSLLCSVWGPHIAFLMH